MKTRLWLICLVIVALLVVVGPVAAKGAPVRVSITGPGIDGEIVVTEPELLEALGLYQFNDLARRIDAPAEPPSNGYRIYRYMMDGESSWDSLTYYPDPAGGLGWLYFDGLNPAIGSTQGQGEWYRPSEAGAAAMRQILTDAGVLASATSASPGGLARPIALPIIFATLMVALIAGGAFLLRRSQTAAAPTAS
jgi:hypothetical protein